jgi:phosphate transport system permease protein
VNGVVLQRGVLSVTEQESRAKVLKRLRRGDAAFRHVTRAAAVTVLVILGGIIVALVLGAAISASAFWSVKPGTR